MGSELELRSASNAEPFTFVLPGHEPDVHLNVLGKEICAHSLILKLYSTYFRKFMDAPRPAEQSTSGYLYEYVTVVDEDGTWGLEKARIAPGDTGANFRGNMVKERQAFFKLILAMYNRPYSLEDVNELLDMVRLADFYRALPILSYSLTVALIRSRPMIETNATILLKTAEKLRNPLLFRECVVHLVANWNNINGAKCDPILLREPHLYSLVKNSYGQVCTEIVETEDRVIGQITDPDDGEVFAIPKEIWTTLKSSSLTKQGGLFECYKEIYDECVRLTRMEDIPHAGSYESIEYAIRPIMNRNLRFPTKDSIIPLRLCYCAEIRDEDLPWDTTQTDW